MPNICGHLIIYYINSQTSEAVDTYGQSLYKKVLCSTPAYISCTIHLSYLSRSVQRSFTVFLMILYENNSSTRWFLQTRLGYYHTHVFTHTSRAVNSGASTRKNLGNAFYARNASARSVASLQDVFISAPYANVQSAAGSDSWEETTICTNMLVK